LVAEVVEEYVKKWGIDAIITFDDRGVTGHINHRATAAGVRYQKPPNGKGVDKKRHFVLSTTPILPAYHLVTTRKYTILIDLPLLIISSIPRLIFNMIYDDEVGLWGVMVASPMMYFTALKAFENHASQVKWNRYKQCVTCEFTIDGITRLYFDTCT